MACNTSGSVIPQISYVFGEFQAEFEGIINTFRGLAVEMRVFSISEDPVPQFGILEAAMGNAVRGQAFPFWKPLSNCWQLIGVDWRSFNENAWPKINLIMNFPACPALVPLRGRYPNGSLSSCPHRLLPFVPLSHLFLSLLIFRQR